MYETHVPEKKSTIGNICVDDITIRKDGKLKPKFTRMANVNGTTKQDIEELLEVQIRDEPEEFTIVSTKLTENKCEEITKLKDTTRSRTE